MSFVPIDTMRIRTGLDTVGHLHQIAHGVAAAAGQRIDVIDRPTRAGPGIQHRARAGVHLAESSNHGTAANDITAGVT